MATYAWFEDLDGLVIGLVLDTGGPAMGPSDGPGAPVDWFEILGQDQARSQRFYTEVFGWQAAGSGGYAMMSTGTGIQGGIGAAEFGSWATVYASVADVEAALASAGAWPGRRPGSRADSGSTTTCRPARFAIRPATCSASTITRRTDLVSAARAPFKHRAPH